jgi:hypothetical protein
MGRKSAEATKARLSSAVRAAAAALAARLTCFLLFLAALAVLAVLVVALALGAFDAVLLAGLAESPAGWLAAESKTAGTARAHTSRSAYVEPEAGKIATLMFSL